MRAPTDPELERLAAKYRAMARLRAARAGNESRAELGELAAEFPSFLRELDTLPAAAIDDRARALAAAAAGGEVADWMRWMVDYHRIMRAALKIKARVGRRRPSDIELEAIAREEHVEPELARAAAHPPRGRLNVVVFAELARRHGREPKEIWDTLFPPRGHARRDYR